MSRRFLRPVSALLTVVFYTVLIAPTAAWAQGFEFDEDEVEDFGEPMEFGDDDGFDVDDWGDDDGWDDGGDVVTTPAVPADDGVLTVTGLFVPGGALEPAVADMLTGSLMDSLRTLPGYVVVSNDPLRTEFEIMGADLASECALDPVCLGRYGRSLGIDKIVIGRGEPANGGAWGVTIDLVDAGSSAIENYRFFSTEPRPAAVEAALTGQLRTLFGLRAVDTGTSSGPRGPSPVQRAMAWTTLGLSVAALGAGVAFGLQASGTEDDLVNCPLIDAADGRVVCDITQSQAQTMIDDGKRQALMSNIFLGSGLFLGVTSIVLFVVTPGSDIDDDADLASGPRLRVSPSVSRDGFGVAGSLSF